MTPRKRPSNSIDEEPEQNRTVIKVPEPNTNTKFWVI